MARRIATVNQKGGVGKTTVVFHLAAGIARTGRKVLVVDCDPQGSLTVAYGFDVNEADTMYEVMTGNCKLGDAIIKINENIDLLPADIALDRCESELLNEPARENILRDILDDDLEKEYDYILFDCRPSLSILTTNAMSAADELLIVLRPEFLNTQATKTLTEYYEIIRKRVNKELTIGGVVINMVDTRRTEHKNGIESICEYFDDRVYKTVLKNNSALSASIPYHMDIFKYAESVKSSSTKNGAVMFEELTKEILNQEGK